ncbi:hypothetical protein F2Q69_00041698 [Brassica cretica]|uniref:Uncharacterized protein n=1 Tax=Brassica cretica TaxID=69181 RepID=A0A8S9NHL2_BRACR|nr:hypothetical protein F2Q69_00041698 [Brassica cretica]
MHEKVALKFLYLAVYACVVSFLQVSCWMVTGERQSARIRVLYLKTILRQDIGFFDTETSTGEVIGRMSGDTILIQDSMGEKVGKFVQLISTFFGGFTVACIIGRRLTVAPIPCIPLIVATGGAMALIMSKMAGRGLHAYAEAGNVIEQAVGSIRTVVAFTREKQATQKYEKKLEIAYKSMVQQGLFSGLGLGIMMVVSYCTYGIAIWYGAWLIMEKGYTGGQVMNVIFASLGGGMSLGQTLPSLNAFAAGQAAAYKMLRVRRTSATFFKLASSHIITRTGSGMTGKVLDEIKGDIELKDVYFRYPARPDVQIFAGFSLVVPNGTTVALVGQSGSGKSTVISLIERFYDPESGEVLIDGIALKKLQLRWIRSKIGLGAYSQLVSLQEVSKKGGVEELELRENISVSHNQTDFGLPRPINLNQTKETHENKSSTENKASKKREKVSLRRLAHLNKPEIPVLLAGSLAAAVHGIVYPVQGLLMSSTIKIFFEPSDQLRKDSHFWAIIFVLLGLTDLIVVPFQNYLFAIAGGRLIKRIRSLSFDKVIHQEISWFDNTESSRLSTDASAVKSIVGDALALIMQNIATVIAALIIAFTANWILAIIILLMTPIIVLQGYFQTKCIAGFSANAKEKYQEASQVASDAVSSIRTVASFCAEDKVMDLYNQKCEALKKQGVRLGLVSGSGYGISFLALYCINSLCFYVGSWLIQKRIATFGEFFQCLKRVLWHLIETKPKTAASIFEILDSKPKIDSSSNEGTVLPIVHGHVEFQHVSFRYPTRPDIQIFSDLCLTISSGQTVALVGESGSGKSTVISLIERFYDPDSGKVLLDQVDVRILKLSWEEEIITAAKAANAHNFISTLPQGYETSVGERGVQLSGGQKQRIAIARTILKDPKVLLLDEATSALDAESERVVQDALDRVMVNRTTVVVAHPLTTIKNADVIAVVNDGVIAERGRHETLMEISGGAYASLVAFHMSAN